MGAGPNGQEPSSPAEMSTFPEGEAASPRTDPRCAVHRSGALRCSRPRRRKPVPNRSTADAPRCSRVVPVALHRALCRVAPAPHGPVLRTGRHPSPRAHADRPNGRGVTGQLFGGPGCDIPKVDDASAAGRNDVRASGIEVQVRTISPSPGRKPAALDRFPSPRPCTFRRPRRSPRRTRPEGRRDSTRARRACRAAEHACRLVGRQPGDGPQECVCSAGKQIGARERACSTSNSVAEASTDKEPVSSGALTFAPTVARRRAARSRRSTGSHPSSSTDPRRGWRR